MKPLLTILLFFMFCTGYCQQTPAVDWDLVDSLIATTPGIGLCLKNGKEDVRFFSKTPEKYSNFKQEFIKQAETAFTFTEATHWYCDISAEINCDGEAGNYTFAVEPRTFKAEDLEYFKQLINLVNTKLKTYEFQPAIYLGEKVNTKVRFRLAAKNGFAILQ